MKKKIRLPELPQFDATEYLNSEKANAGYLTAMIEGRDRALLAAALGVRLVARPAQR